MAQAEPAFLFTDIEGSTRRWDAYPEAMRDAVRRHDALFRSEMERRGGHVFKALGDAFCVAFTAPAMALDAAVNVQRALECEDFSAVGGLRVRIAIAAGEAEIRDGDYFGTSLNRAARLLSAGNGGQILVSGEAADAIARESIDGVTLRQLGTVTLRDLKDPVVVYQAVAHGVRADFRALRTLETPPNNLPRQTSTFIGRNADVLKLQDLLEHHALVTIGGAGGMGKTRLALETAGAVLNDRKDGTWFVDLASIVDGALVASVILSTLGGERAANVAPLEALIAHVQAREMLLVLDNCEHVIDDVATVVSTIVQRCSHVALLATSRERLNVSGERLYQLDSLGLSTSVELFNERAAAARPGFDSQREAPEVAEICRRLDGIALGIELAAAAIRSMPARTLLDHFDLRLLSGGRDRQPRQQTMSALIEWSYGLLEPRERDFLRRCAPCIGGFTLESAIMLGGADDVTTIDFLSLLVDKSLLTANAARARYRMLEPIRQFAMERHEQSGERHGALESHARAYGAFAREGFSEWEAAPQPDWPERMEAELGNLRAALTWCDANQHYVEEAAMAANAAPAFLRLSLPAEGAEWCERSLTAIPDGQDELQARLHYVLSMLYQNLGQSAKSLEHAESAVARYRQLSRSGTMLSRALSQLAHRYSVQRRYVDARSAATEAMDVARGLDDTRLLADVLRRSAPAFAEQSDRMNEIYGESVALFRSTGNDEDAARSLVWWGQSQAGLGQYARAAEHLMEARAQARQELASSLLGDAVSCFLMTGDLQTARQLAREELATNAKAPHPIETPIALLHVAALSDEQHPQSAACLSVYAQTRLRDAGWQLDAAESAIVDALHCRLAERLPSNELERLYSQSAALTTEAALTDAARLADAWA